MSVNEIHVQHGWRLLTEHNLRLLNHFKKQARTIFNSRDHLLDDSVVLDPRPQVSASDFEVIVATVRATLRKGATMRVYKPYMDILVDCGGGLQALEILDPLLHDPEHNIPIYPEEFNRVAFTDYRHQIMYVSLLSWAREVSPTISHPELASRCCSFDDCILPIGDSTLSPPAENLPNLLKPWTSTENGEQTKILYDCITHTRPGYVNLYSLLQYQNPIKPVTPKLENMTVQVILDVFKAMADRYKGSTPGSLPLTRSYKWYPKPIEELVPGVFHAFLSRISAYATILHPASFIHIIVSLNEAVYVDIRVSRSMSADCVAAILSAVVNRVHQLTIISYPIANMELHLAEALLHRVLHWIGSIFISLSGMEESQSDSRIAEIIDVDIVYSDDAKSTVAIATAIKPILLHALTSKTNPFMYTQILIFLNTVFSLKEFPDEVPLTILTKPFWAAITAAFTVPFDREADAARLHHGSIVTVYPDGKTPTVLKTAQDFNNWAIIRCCKLLNSMCVRGMVAGSQLNAVGKTLLKRGLVQFFYQQDALHPDNVSISSTLVDILVCMSRVRDGRLLLLHASDLGCRFSGIELLRHFLLHSESKIVSMACRLCFFLVGDSQFHPLLLAMDPPIEDIVLKLISLAIFHIIERAEEQFERVQIKYQLELLCRQSGVQYSSLKFASWSIGHDFMGSSSAMRFRRHAAYLPVGRDSSAADMFVHSLLAICELSSIKDDRLVARLRSRKLVVLIINTSHLPLNSISCKLSLQSLKNLLECNAFHPSDLPDPYRDIGELAIIMVACIINDVHNEVVDAMGSLFADERLKPSSVWDKYFLSIEESPFRDTERFELYKRIFAPSSSKSSSSSTVLSAIPTDQVFGRFDDERRSPMLLQLKTCANRSCGGVELNSGTFKTCSKCRSVWYCSVVCQSTDWRRHKKTDCET